MSSLDIEIRKLDINKVLKLSDLLEKNNSWKNLMGIIPADLSTENCSSYKYSWDDVQLVEQAKEQQQRSCTAILFEEWGTSGKVRPRLSHLRELLVKAELFRAADYVSEILDLPPPERPETGPAAQVPIPNLNQLRQRAEDVSFSLNLRPVLLPNPAALVSQEPQSSESQISAENILHDDVIEERSFEIQGTTTQSCVDNKDGVVFENEAISLPFTLLAEATDNFCEEYCLGKGACGSVYLGHLNSYPHKIAVKKFHENGVPGGADKQFHNEIDTLFKINHPNLLKLLGFATDGISLCLVYPFMNNGSLCDMLASEDGRRKLLWRSRLENGLGVANGIAYLHGFQPHPLIHRDIKTANVLLDENLKPKLCDFGLIRASQNGRNQTTSLTTTIIGTTHYMPLEAFRGEISVKTDVFSFGVVLLELLTGLPALDDDGPLVDLIFDKCIDKDPTNDVLLNDLVDSLAGDWGGDLANGAACQFLQVALNCIASDKRSRPIITNVVDRLQRIFSDYT